MMSAERYARLFVDARFGCDLRSRVWEGGVEEAEPHQSAKAHLGSVLETLWKDSAAGRMIHHTEAVQDLVPDLDCCPVSSVPKLLADRTEIGERRTVHDAQEKNLDAHLELFPGVDLPTFQQRARKV